MRVPTHPEVPDAVQPDAARALSAKLFPAFRFGPDTGRAIFFERDPARSGMCQDCDPDALPPEEDIVRAELWIVYGAAFIGWGPGVGYFFEVDIEIERGDWLHWSCWTLDSLDEVVHALSVPLVAYARMGAKMRPELIEAMTRLGLLGGEAPGAEVECASR